MNKRTLSKYIKDFKQSGEEYKVYNDVKLIIIKHTLITEDGNVCIDMDFEDIEGYLDSNYLFYNDKGMSLNDMIN